MPTAADWRELAKEASARYADTPDGAPPWELIEAAINLESTGDPNAQGPPTIYGPAQGLTQMVATGLDWPMWITQGAPDADYLSDPYNVWNPETNINAYAHALNWRQERWDEPDGAGGYLFPDPSGKAYIGAMRNWFVAATSYFGAANNSGINTAADVLGTSGVDYANTLYDYIMETFGHDRAQSIDAEFFGEVTQLANEDEGWTGPDGKIREGIEDGIEDAVLGPLVDALNDIMAQVPEIAARTGLFLTGGVLLLIGLKRTVAA